MRDNHPKHRQLSRERAKLARKKASRAGMPAMLIVCEGRETEPNYIEGLCGKHRINLANVTIVRGDDSTDVLSLVKRAKMLFERDRDFDRVFVVFDDDGQPLEKAQELAAKRLKTHSGKSIGIELIASKPSFELWLLLHFEYTTRPFANAAEVMAALGAYLTNYDKADRRLFVQLASGMDRAMANAERLQRDAAQGGGLYPQTGMHSLIRSLLEISGQGGE